MKLPINVAQERLAKFNAITEAALYELDDPERTYPYDDVPEVRKRIRELKFATHYADPNSDTDGIVFGDLNFAVPDGCSEEIMLHADTDSFWAQFVRDLEQAGFEVEWLGEWAVCQCCGGAMRNGPPAPWPPPFFYEQDGKFTCQECIKDDPAELEAYLEWVKSGDHLIELEIPLGLPYVRLVKNLKIFGPPGEDPALAKLTEDLEASNFRHFLFQVDERLKTGVTLSFWMHRHEMDRGLQAFRLIKNFFFPEL